jgi:hypothetical protein
MTLNQYRAVLIECLVTLRHARVFAASREKMHPTGLELYDQLVIDVENALKSPDPELAPRGNNDVQK